MSERDRWTSILPQLHILPRPLCKVRLSLGLITLPYLKRVPLLPLIFLRLGYCCISDCGQTDSFGVDLSGLKALIAW